MQSDGFSPNQRKDPSIKILTESKGLLPDNDKVTKEVVAVLICPWGHPMCTGRHFKPQPPLRQAS